MAGQEVATTSTTEEQFRAFFREKFGFKADAEEAAAKLLSWADEVREDDGKFIIFIPNLVETSLTTRLDFKPKENMLMAALVSRTEEWRVVSGNFLKLNWITRVRVLDEGETVNFYLRDNSVLRVKESGVIAYFGQLERKGRGRGS